MNTSPARLPLRASQRLFTSAEIAILAGAVVVVTSQLGQWHGTAPAERAAARDMTAGTPRVMVNADGLEAVPHQAFDPALNGLLPAHGPSPDAIAGAYTARAEE